MKLSIIVSVLVCLCLPLRDVTAATGESLLPRAWRCKTPKNHPFASFLPPPVEGYESFNDVTDPNCCKRRDLKNKCCTVSGQCKCHQDVTCGKCEAGWAFINVGTEEVPVNKCFKLFLDEIMPFADALTKCAAEGGGLAILKMYGPNIKIMEEFRSKIGEYKIWVGLQYNSGWKWSNANGLTSGEFMQWKASADGTDRNAVVKGAACDSVWEIVDKTEDHAFICEKAYPEPALAGGI